MEMEADTSSRMTEKAKNWEGEEGGENDLVSAVKIYRRLFITNFCEDKGEGAFKISEVTAH